MSARSSDRAPPIAVTTGEPAGIGPDLVLMLGGAATRSHPWLAVGDRQMLASRAALLGLDVEVREWCGAQTGPGVVDVVPAPLAAQCLPGHPDPGNAAYVLETLDIAIDGCLNGRFAGMVTAPVSKAVISHSGVPFTGHTEYLAERTGTGQVVMMLVAGALRVALVTTHLPLARVAGEITRTRVASALRVLAADMARWFGIPRPRIAVCGLNPHAGESGLLGNEEREVLEPEIARAREAGIDARGPLPADTAFAPSALSGVDVVLAMYHDQGLPVVKHAGFGRAVNVTLGLPIVRTSVDHGTAFELAGTVEPDPGSLACALETAAQMVAQRSG